MEPGVAESRIVDPFGEATWKPWRGLGLANYWDVRPLCRYLDGRLMPLQQSRRCFRRCHCQRSRVALEGASLSRCSLAIAA